MLAFRLIRRIAAATRDRLLVSMRVVVLEVPVFATCVLPACFSVVVEPLALFGESHGYLPCPGEPVALFDLETKPSVGGLSVLETVIPNRCFPKFVLLELSHCVPFQGLGAMGDNVHDPVTHVKSCLNPTNT